MRLGSLDEADIVVSDASPADKHLKRLKKFRAKLHVLALAAENGEAVS